MTHIKDCMERAWQCGTIQLDFSMPVRFAEAGLNITYVDKDNAYLAPVMIHRAALGSLERFIGIIIEEYAGKFPLWLAPVQAVVVPVTAEHNSYADELAAGLRCESLRVSVDARNEKLGYRVREAIVKKVPYILVVGDREMADSSVNVRHRELKDVGTMDKQKVLDSLTEEYRQRKLVSVFS